MPKPVEGTFLFLPVISTPLNHRIIYYYTRCLSLSKAHSHFSSRCLSLPKAHYFYCIKICVLHRTSLMFLWELKNAIISTNLRELCVIEPPKPNRKIPPNVPERSRRQGRGKEFFSINALASRRHIISIALKSVCSIEHLWCSFENSKTPSFQQIFVNFVLLKLLT